MNNSYTIFRTSFEYEGRTVYVQENHGLFGRVEE